MSDDMFHTEGSGQNFGCRALICAYRANVPGLTESGRAMPALSAEKKALSFLRALEAEGHIVKRVVVEGKRIELELESTTAGPYDFDKLELRYDKAGAS
jgi:hypothetical protein